MNGKNRFRSFLKWLLRTFWKLCKWVFKLLGKLLLFGAWMICELFAAVFAALAKWLKGIITAKQ